MQVKCHRCSEKLPKEQAVKITNVYYHPRCAELYLDRKDLLEYICKLMNFKAPGPKVYRQLKMFNEKYSHFTYKGIEETLRYFFEVKKNKIEKAQEGIGIVPYVYEEAQEYWTKMKEKKEKIANEVGKTLERRIEVVEIKKAEKKREKLLQEKIIDLENL